MLLLRAWLGCIVIYNLASGLLAISNPSTLEALFPGSRHVFGLEPSTLSRVLGSYALSIAGVRLVFVCCPTSGPAFASVLWTFVAFEAMFALEVYHGLPLETVLVGVVAGTASVALMGLYKAAGWLEEPPKQKGA